MNFPNQPDFGFIQRSFEVELNIYLSIYAAVAGETRIDIFLYIPHVFHLVSPSEPKRPRSVAGGSKRLRYEKFQRVKGFEVSTVCGLGFSRKTPRRAWKVIQWRLVPRKIGIPRF